MTVTVNTKAYTFDTNPTPNSAKYVGPSNSMSLKDTLELKRVAGKPTATFPGVARSSAKFVKTVTVSGETYDAIVEVSCSIPVGTAAGDIDSIRDDAGDFIISSNGGDLVKSHKIVQ